MGFKKYPKDFSALMPGHRPQSVGEEAGRNLIANNPQSKLTAKMVESLLLYWVPKVSSSVKQQIADGKGSDYAYIVSFSKLGYPSFVRIYFHIVDKEYSEEQITAIQAGVEALTAEMKRTKEQVTSQEKTEQTTAIKRQHKRELKEKDVIIKQKTTEIKSLTKELSQERKEKATLVRENKKIDLLQDQLSGATSEIETLRIKVAEGSKHIKELQESYEQSEKSVQGLNEENASIQHELDQCHTQLTEMEELRQSTLKLIYSDSTDELRPVDMDEFNEYLSYNLTNIGLEKTKAYFPLLLGFLGRTVFTNKPIICDQSSGHALARCISNTICGSQNTTIIPYSKGITSRDIKSVLETDTRVIVFDSFLGNYNEQELLPILRSVKRKIVFITAEYDKTISFLPEEVLCNCIYLNTNHIVQLHVASNLDEDPSTLKEELVPPVFRTNSNRAQRLCKEIMKELGFSSVVANSFSVQMTSETMLDEYLVYSVLPYAIEAFGISPFNKSDRLGKYAGFSGKCVHKELMLEWFGDV